MRTRRLTVPREMYEDMKRARDIWQQECSALRIEMSALMRDVLAVKRHDLGIPPAGALPENPASIVGPLTLSAIEQVSEGYADVYAHQMNLAVRETRAGLASKRDPEELDAALAEMIRQGDEA